MVRYHASDGDVCRAISKLRQLLQGVAHVINNDSAVCLSKCAWKTVYLLRYCVILMFIFQGLNWGIPPDLRSPTSAFRSATCSLGSTTSKYRFGTFLLGSTNVKHRILTVWWIHVSAQHSTAGRDHLAVACAPRHHVIFLFDAFMIIYGTLKNEVLCVFTRKVSSN